ncbi:MAG: S-formylglutathione hydrolase [Rhodobacteraceae bacterium]|nr:S-formylglutathione hydrolase [Paracoccaceae bacterium]
MRIVSEQRAFGGVQSVCAHPSETCGCDMTFGLYLPPQARDGKVPVLWFLAGLTCTHENAMLKAGAQAHAAEQGFALIFPDTSPRGAGVPDDPAFDLGQGAGFYVNATEAPWDAHFAMWDYVTEELPALVFPRFPLDPDLQAISGHSMGGHGALTIAMAFPERFAAVSAFAPIANPVRSAWGQKQFRAYLGEDTTAWEPHDATLMMEDVGFPGPVLIDQGGADPYLDLLMPEALAAAMAARRQPGAFRVQAGYDHSYFFVASFIADHLDFHARAMAD